MTWWTWLHDVAWRTERVALPPYAQAFGVTLGGGLLGALGRSLAGHGPVDPATVAFRIRIWAVAVAIGGTLTAFEQIERGLASGSLPDLLRDFVIVFAAYAGAQSAYWSLHWLVSP
ncbi:MAG: YtrH family sporulation protein [Firmicutes bacterium]|nr:YtrH family sporulation protein [Bacillota bacterium]